MFYFKLTINLHFLVLCIISSDKVYNTTIVYSSVTCFNFVDNMANFMKFESNHHFEKSKIYKLIPSGMCLYDVRERIIQYWSVSIINNIKDYTDVLIPNFDLYSVVINFEYKNIKKGKIT